MMRFAIFICLIGAGLALPVEEAAGEVKREAHVEGPWGPMPGVRPDGSNEDEVHRPPCPTNCIEDSESGSSESNQQRHIEGPWGPMPSGPNSGHKVKPGCPPWCPIGGQIPWPPKRPAHGHDHRKGHEEECPTCVTWG